MQARRLIIMRISLARRHSGCAPSLQYGAFASATPAGRRWRAYPGIVLSSKDGVIFDHRNDEESGSEHPSSVKANRLCHAPVWCRLRHCPEGRLEPPRGRLAWFAGRVGGETGEGGFDLPGQRHRVAILVDPQCGVKAGFGLVAVTGELVHFGFGYQKAGLEPHVKGWRDQCLCLGYELAGGGEPAVPGEQLGPGCPPQGLGQDVVGRADCLGFFGHLLRIIEAPLQVQGFGEQGGEGAAMPAFAYRAECLIPFPPAALRRGRVAGGQLDKTGPLGLRARASLAPEAVSSDRQRADAARASARRPA